jgi:hypothetical protein
MKGPAGAQRDLRILVIAAGIAAALSFLVVGLAVALQTYGDGSIFSYAVATREVWAFHWHNIATRAATYVLTLAPGEIAVALTGAPSAGVFVYGLCLFAAPAVCLATTFALDRSAHRLYFAFACASTALACPLVFGFPTEMWVAHALFWPAFACAMTLSVSFVSSALLAVLTVALALAHEGGLVLAFGIVAATALRGLGEARFLRALSGFALALITWLAVNRVAQPDAYFGEVRLRAASEFFDGRIFVAPPVLLLLAAVVAYALLHLALSRIAGRRAPLIAAAFVGGALIVWWALFDMALHADNRYYLRTVLLIATCAFAGVAGLMQLAAENTVVARVAPLQRALVLFVHVVETAKFVRGFAGYRAAVRALALGEASDPQLGAPFLVSSQRIRPDLQRLSWFSTTPYLSALVADFRPGKLVVDPAGNYFWLSCATATEAADAMRAVPKETREMIRVYSCLHRN